MKKIVGILLLFIGIFTNTFSQHIVMDINIPKLEKDVISDIRIYESYGQISDNMRYGDSEAWELSQKGQDGSYRVVARLAGWKSGDLGLETMHVAGSDYINADMHQFDRFYLAISLKGAPKGGRIVGSRRNDYLTGSEHRDWIETGDGATNLVFGYGGDDDIRGGTGMDYIRAGKIGRAHV